MAKKRRGHHIFVVDDDIIIRDLLETALGRAGFQVSSVPNGLKLVSSLKVHRPDLILMDVRMSWIDGYELCRMIHQREEYRQVPIIFISGLNYPQAIEEGLACGAVDFLVKPLDLPQLIEVVRRHLGLIEEDRKTS